MQARASQVLLAEEALRVAQRGRQEDRILHDSSVTPRLLDTESSHTLDEMPRPEMGNALRSYRL